MSLPPPLDVLDATDSAVLSRCLSSVRFPAGACIFTAGEPADACYIIDEGIVRIDLDRPGAQPAEIDSETALGYVKSGGLLGELGLLDRLPRSASAYAQTEVAARRIGASDIEALVQAHPRVACALYAALGRGAALKLRRMNERLAHTTPEDAPDPEVDAMVARAVAAQREIQSWTEGRIDDLLRAMAQAVADRAEELARASVAETGMGDVPSKIIKDRLCSLGAYQALAGRPGQGPLATDEQRAVTEIASPAGVIFGLVPVTNPVSTFIFKSLSAVKGRNALILSPHRRALGVSARAEEIIQEVLRAHGAPVDLIQCVRARASRKKTAQFMAHEDVALILATGGASMVKAAYSSGTPAIGVGSANTPVLICADADVERAVRHIVMSKTFDHGLLCGAEHNLVVAASIRQAVVEECERQGAAVLSPDEVALVGRVLIDPATGRLRHQAIGQSAARIAQYIGIRRPYPIRLIVVPGGEISASNPFAREKLAPMASAARPSSKRTRARCTSVAGADSRATRCASS